MKPNFIILQLPEMASHVEIGSLTGDLIYNVGVQPDWLKLGGKYKIHCTRDTVTEELAREVVDSKVHPIFNIDWYLDYMSINKKGWIQNPVSSIHSLAESSGFKNWVIIKKS